MKKFLPFARVNPALPPRVSPGRLLAAAWVEANPPRRLALELLDQRSSTAFAGIPAPRWLNLGSGRKAAGDRGGEVWQTFLEFATQKVISPEEGEDAEDRLFGAAYPEIRGAVEKISSLLRREDWRWGDVVSLLAELFRPGTVLSGMWVDHLSGKIENLAFAARAISPSERKEKREEVRALGARIRRLVRRRAAARRGAD